MSLGCSRAGLLLIGDLPKLLARPAGGPRAPIPAIAACTWRDPAVKPEPPIQLPDHVGADVVLHDVSIGGIGAREAAGLTPVRSR
jgi:hypothetical protein